MQNIILTSAGLSALANANANGPYVEIGYYLPVYDYRIDPTIHPTSSAWNVNDITTVASSGDLVPSGEVLWNNHKYVLSTSAVYISSATGVTASTVTLSNAVQTAETPVNLIYDATSGYLPVGNFFKATSLVTSASKTNATTFVATDNWVATSAYGFTDVTNKITPDATYLYKGVTYDPIVTSAGNRGQFRIEVRPSNLGDSLKFNKLGLYSVSRTSQGTIVNPTLFAEVILSTPQIITKVSNGIDAVTVEVQLAVQSVSANFQDILFSTSGDYWKRVSRQTDGKFGLSYEGDVYITSELAYDDVNTQFNTDYDTGTSKLFISTFQTIPSANIDDPSREALLPQLGLQYVSSTDGTKRRIRTTFRTTSIGNCEVDFYGYCGSANTVYSITPSLDDAFGIGSLDQRWNYGYFSNYFIVGTSGTANKRFEIDVDNSVITTNNMDLRVVTGTDKYLVGNLRSYTGDALLIRNSKVDNTNTAETDIAILGGNFTYSSNNSNSLVSNLPDVSALGTIIDAYKAWLGSDEWIFSELVKYSGAVYISGNGYIPLLGSATFFEDALPAKDNTINLGVQVSNKTVPLAFASVATNKLTNFTRDMSIDSSLIPSNKNVALGNASNAFNIIASNSVNINNNLSIGTITIDKTNGVDLNKQNITDGNLIQTDTLEVSNIVFTGSNSNFWTPIYRLQDFTVGFPITTNPMGWFNTSDFYPESGRPNNANYNSAPSTPYIMIYKNMFSGGYKLSFTWNRNNNPLWFNYPSDVNTSNVKPVAANTSDIFSYYGLDIDRSSYNNTTTVYKTYQLVATGTSTVTYGVPGIDWSTSTDMSIGVNKYTGIVYLTPTKYSANKSISKVVVYSVGSSTSTDVNLNFIGNAGFDYSKLYQGTDATFDIYFNAGEIINIDYLSSSTWEKVVPNTNLTVG